MNNNKNKATNYVKYTGIAFQMLATIGVFAFVGYQIDRYAGNQKLIYTAILGVIGVVASLYQVIRSLNKQE
jgi:F0F1-type ATP synthase assembly protein I